MAFRKHRVNKRRFFTRPVWRNSVGNIKSHPLKYYTPENLDDLMAITGEAIQNKISVRAVGAGHSYSDASSTNGLLADMMKLSKNLGTYQYTSRQGHFIEFEGGITIRQMNNELDAMNLSVPTMGGIDHQTLAGAIQTGTHGSNLTVGALSAIVRSLVLVTSHPDKEEAKAYRIEKSDGFTDRNTYPSGAPELIQDDEVFHSVVVSFGCMGIIYSMVIEVENQFFLEERKSVDSWENVKALLKGGVLQQHRSVYVQVNPYLVEGKRLAMIAWHDRTDTLSMMTRVKEDIKHKLLYRIDKAIRNPISQLGNLPPAYLIFVAYINSNPRGVPNIINSAIRNQKDKTYVNKAHKVMYQGLDYLKERAYDSEFAIEIKNDKYLELLEDLIVLLQDLHQKYSFQLSSPIGMRFVKQSDIFLTPEYQKNVCYIDTPVLKNAYGNEVLLYHIQVLFMKHGALPHWGKMNEHVTKEYIRHAYPRFDRWMVQFNRFNRNRTFSNNFSRRMVEVDTAQ